MRPIEEFRNTPLIPISDRQMQDYKDRVEKFHRKGVFLEVRKDSLVSFGIRRIIILSYNFAGIFVGALYLMSLLIRYVLSREEEAGVAYQRLKLQRIREY